MARLIKVSNATAGANVPEDVYKAEVVGLQDKQMEWEGKMHDKLEFTFRIVDDQYYEGIEIRGLAEYPEYLTPKCKLRAWAQAIMGRELGADETVDLDAMIGRQCRISTVNKEGKQGGTFSNIKDVFPARAARGNGNQAPQQQAVNY